MNSPPAAPGFIRRQQPGGNPALAAKPIRRSAGLFYTFLIAMGIVSGFSFYPLFAEIFGADDSIGILTGILGAAVGLCLALLYAQRYMRAYNGWPWLLLGAVAWLSAGLLILLGAILFAAVISVVSCFIVLTFLFTIFLHLFRRSI